VREAEHREAQQRRQNKGCRVEKAQGESEQRRHNLCLSASVPVLPHGCRRTSKIRMTLCAFFYLCENQIVPYVYNANRHSTGGGTTQEHECGGT